MLVRVDKNHGECVVVIKNIISLFTVVNGAICAKGYGAQESLIRDVPSVIFFFGDFMDGVKKTSGAMKIQTDQYSKQIIVDENDIKYFVWKSTYVSIKDSVSDDFKSYAPIFCNIFINGIERK